MDTTPEYIKMAEKATEIQKLRHPKEMVHFACFPFEDGDFVFVNGYCVSGDGEVIVMGGESFSIYYYHPEGEDGHLDLNSMGFCEGDGGKIDDAVWLPRQDQLQKMIIGRGGRESRIVVHESLYRFSYSNYKKGAHPTNIFDTQEQLWLAFVMKEKYGKVWNGTDWVVE